MNVLCCTNSWGRVGDTRPELSKVGNCVECNISLTSQVFFYGSCDWSTVGHVIFSPSLKGDMTCGLT